MCHADIGTRIEFSKIRGKDQAKQTQNASEIVMGR